MEKINDASSTVLYECIWLWNYYSIVVVISYSSGLTNELWLGELNGIDALTLALAIVEEGVWSDTVEDLGC